MGQIDSNSVLSGPKNLIVCLNLKLNRKWLMVSRFEKKSQNMDRISSSQDG